MGILALGVHSKANSCGHRGDVSQNDQIGFVATAPKTGAALTVAVGAAQLGAGPLNVASRSRTRNRKPAARSPIVITKLRACWVTHCPVGCRGDPEDVDLTRTDLEEEEHIDPAQQHGVHGEQVAGQHRLRLRPAELPPRGPAASRRGVDTRPAQDVPHRRGRDPVADADQLTVDAAMTPAREMLSSTFPELCEAADYV